MDDERDGELKSEQAGSVVNETLPFEDIHDAAGQPDAPGDGSGGDGVGGGDDGAEHESEAPVKTDKDGGRNQGDGQNGEADQAEGKKKDADEVIPEVTPGSGPGGRIEQWRKDDQKNNVGIEGDAGHAG